VSASELRPLAALALLVCFAGCSFTVGRFALASTRDPEPGRGGDPRRVTARSCVPILFVFPAGRLPNVGRAIDAALGTGGGTLMRQVVIRYEMLYLPLVFGEACYVVEGEVS
jgi:hypothetical protein